MLLIILKGYNEIFYGTWVWIVRKFIRSVRNFFTSLLVRASWTSNQLGTLTNLISTSDCGGLGLSMMLFGEGWLLISMGKTGIVGCFVLLLVFQDMGFRRTFVQVKTGFPGSSIIRLIGVMVWRFAMILGVQLLPLLVYFPPVTI